MGDEIWMDAGRPEASAELVPPRRWRRRGVALVGALCLVAGTVAGVGIGTVLAGRSRYDIEELLRPTSTEEHAVDVIVFLQPAPTVAVEAEMAERVRVDAGIRAACFYSAEDSLAEFRELFADEPGMVNQVTAAQLPPSFRIDVAGDKAQVDRIVREYRALPQVREVVVSSVSRLAPEARQLLSSVQGDSVLIQSERWDCESGGRMVVG